MPHPVDEFVGQRLRHRRWLVGMTQQQLGEAVGIKFQQIQKYESGVNRVSASRLWDIARTLQVPVSFFFEGLPLDDEDESGAASGANGNEHMAGHENGFAKTEEGEMNGGSASNGMQHGASNGQGDILLNKETAELIRAYHNIPETQRRRLLDLARAMGDAG